MQAFSVINYNFFAELRIAPLTIVEIPTFLKHEAQNCVLTDFFCVLDRLYLAISKFYRRYQNFRPDNKKARCYPRHI